MLKIKENKNLIVYFCILIFLSTFAITSQINLSNDIFLNSDGFFHLQRYFNLCKRLQDGHLGLFIDYNAMYNFGYPTPLFYPEIFMYPFAFLTILKVPEIITFKLFIITIFIFTAISMFLVLSKINKNANIFSVIFSLIYTFNFLQYRHLLAGRYAELLAMIFVPLVLYGVYLLVEKNCGIKYIIIGMSGIIYSHILTAVILTITIAVLMLLNINKIIKNKNILLNLIKASLLTLLITAKQIFPIMEMMISDNYIYNYSFAKRPTFNEMTNKIIENPNMISSIVICLLFFLFIVFSYKISNKLKYIILGCFIYSLNTTLFDWSFIENNFSKITDIMQFPRRLMPPVVALILLGIYSLVYSKNYKIIKKISNILIILVFIINFCIFSFAPLPKEDVYSYSHNIESFENGIYIGAYDYLTIKFDLNEITDENNNYVNEIGNLFLEQKNNNISLTMKDNCYIINTTKDYDKLEVPILFYKGYKAKSNNKFIDLYQNENGLLQFDNVKQNQEIIIKYYMTPIQTISIILSFIGLTYCLYLYIKNKKA